MSKSGCCQQQFISVPTATSVSPQSPYQSQRRVATYPSLSRTDLPVEGHARPDHPRRPARIRCPSLRSLSTRQAMRRSVSERVRAAGCTHRGGSLLARLADWSSAAVTRPRNRLRRRRPGRSLPDPATPGIPRPYRWSGIRACCSGCFRRAGRRRSRSCNPRHPCGCASRL